MPPRWLDLVRDLRRRRVLRVAGIYVVAGWVAIQAAATIFPALGMPAWTVTFVVVLALIGFPVTLALAWAFDLTPDGVRRTAPPVAEASPSTAPPRERRRLTAAAVLVVLAAVAVAGWRVAVGRRAATAPAATATATAGTDAARSHSIAVLPFVNMSGDPKEEYFSDGVTEEILNALAQIPGLQVAGRTSSFAFKGKNLNLSDIGRALHVGTVLEGSIQRSGGEVRITAQLIDARTDYHLWSRTYDRELKNVFAVEDEISRAIADTLKLQLGAGTSLAQTATRSTQAHDLYLQGLYHWNRRGGGDLKEAIASFEQAVAADPSYAPAYAGLALSYVLLPVYAGVSEAQVVAPVEAAAGRALALDSTLADAHLALAFLAYHVTDEDDARAEAHFRRALQLGQANATAHQWFGEFLGYTGRAAEGVPELRRALELDPLSPVIHADYAGVLYNGGRFQEAVAEADRALRLDPMLTPAFFFRAVSYFSMGRLEDGLRGIEIWAPAMVGGTPAQWREIRTLALDRSRRAELFRALDATSPRGAVYLYAALGERERALDALARVPPGARQRWRFDARLLDPLRDDPRWERAFARGAGQ